MSPSLTTPSVSGVHLQLFYVSFLTLLLVLRAVALADLDVWLDGRPFLLDRNLLEHGHYFVFVAGGP